LDSPVCELGTVGENKLKLTTEGLELAGDLPLNSIEEHEKNSSVLQASSMHSPELSKQLKPVSEMSSLARKNDTDQFSETTGQYTMVRGATFGLKEDDPAEITAIAVSKEKRATPYLSVNARGGSKLINSH
jgi:hypothetical protein